MAKLRHISAALVTMVTAIMLLALVVPHHHHESEVCFSDEHCQPEAVHHGEPGCPDNEEHSHDLPGDVASCMLIHEFLVPDLKVKQAKPEQHQKFDNAVDLYWVGYPSCMLDLPDKRTPEYPLLADVKYTPLIITLHTLRGPPVGA